MEAHFHPSPHKEAAAQIRNKPAIARAVFDQMLPELRGRAFTIAGVESANVMQRVRDSIATVAEGSTWDDAKDNIIAELDPFLGGGSERRAELLLRTHGFQSFQSAEWRGAQEDEDVTHLQYMTMEDERVRASHAALEGIVLPKNDPFWQTHFPPWEWGCRCRTRTMNPDQVDEVKSQDAKRAPDSKLLIEGPALKKLRDGHLFREGQTYDVSPSEDKGAFNWDPNDLRIPLADLKPRYDAETWTAFESMAKGAKIEDEVSLWDYLGGKKDLPELPAQESEPEPAKEQPEFESPGLEAFKARFVDLKFKKPILKVVSEIPPSAGEFIADLKVEKTRGRAHYTGGTIHVSGNPDNWNGLPATILHETGHHLHYATGTITLHQTSPEFMEAMKKDFAALKTFVEERHPKDGMDTYHHTRSIATAEDLAQAMGLGKFQELTDLAERFRVGRVADTISGLSSGQYGYGHSLNYMRTKGPKEVYAHAFSALVDKDPFYQKLFPNVLAIVAKSLKIP